MKLMETKMREEITRLNLFGKYFMRPFVDFAFTYMHKLADLFCHTSTTLVVFVDLLQPVKPGLLK